MPVDVDEEEQLLSILLFELLCKVSNSDDLWEDEVSLIAVDSVQVFS